MCLQIRNVISLRPALNKFILALTMTLGGIFRRLIPIILKKRDWGPGNKSLNHKLMNLPTIARKMRTITVRRTNRKKKSPPQASARIIHFPYSLSFTILMIGLNDKAFFLTAQDNNFCTLRKVSTFEIA